ncbi:MAG: chromosome segregation SMC family protein, partial [Planctomycetaceae bacterium]
MTRLVALEVVGFKSFADRTRFDFPEGLTAIVGPNGSGKSNVVDAVKWVLGEQSVRSLRGREMTDVIFSGSASRRPLNAAETTLIFENASRDLPLDADEVRITRRVYRSGEGEYLVNGEASRLRDIRELLSGTGAGAEAYSVIEQGRVDALLVASGRDRRAVFEEAAGITRFRVRRAEALRRLERTDHSLARLGDILGEVAGRLGTVRQQAAPARRHRELTARLRTLRLAIASTDMVVIDQEIADGRRSITAVRENLGMFEAFLNDAAARARAIQSDDENLGLSIEAHRTTVAEWRQTAAAAEASRRGSIDQRTAIADDALQLSKRLGMALGRHRAGSASTEATRRQIAEAQMKLDSLNESISQLPSDDEDIDGMSEARQRVLAARERSRQCDAAHRERMTELSRIEDELDRAISAIEPTRQAAESAVAEQTEFEFRRSACQGLQKSLEERSLVAAEAVREAERDAAAVADSIIARMDEQGSWRARLDSCRGRRETLAELVERRDGVSQAVRDLLANPFEGIAGLVSEVVDAQPDIARIVDAALGGRSTPIAVESLESMPEGGVTNAHRS